MMTLQAISADDLRTKKLPERTALLRMADSKELLVEPFDDITVHANCDLIFNDSSSDYGLVRSPTIRDAEAILKFYRESSGCLNFVAQCQVGVGRSHAVVCALAKIRGQENRHILKNGTYNRKLYRLILEAAGVALEPDPLVSIVVRVKYDRDKLEAFMLSMKRQRYENWEVIAVSDGPNRELWHQESKHRSGTFVPIQTLQPFGRWGHPYRQKGIDAAQGKYIGLQNDDNYLTPGYIEQLVLALEAGNDVALCPIVHSYAGFEVTQAGGDIGCWLARADLVKSIPWTGQQWNSDREYLKQLIEGRKVVVVDRPLYVHC